MNVLFFLQVCLPLIQQQVRPGPLGASGPPATLSASSTGAGSALATAGPIPRRQVPISAWGRTWRTEIARGDSAKVSHASQL